MRDVALPHGYRLHALASCIQIAQPIGFNATWSYLVARLRISPREPEFLPPAIDLLKTERAAHLTLDAAYGSMRRQQKRAGLRFPPRADATPRNPIRWHGDESTGAIHALTFWRNDRYDAAVAEHANGRPVLTAVDLALESPESPAIDLDDLQRGLDWTRRQVHVVGWEADREEYRVAWVVHYLLGQLHLVINGAPTIGAPWNFV